MNEHMNEHTNERRAARAAEVVREVRTYVREYNRGDFAACVTHYAFPFSYVSANGIKWVQSREEFLRTWPETQASMKAAGWVRSDYPEHNVTFLGDGVALESHVLVRYGADDKVLERTGSTFVVRREGNAWRLVSCLQHRPEDMLRTGIEVPARD